MNDNTGHWIQQYAEQNLRLQERISELEAQLKRAEAALETAHTAGYSDGYSAGFKDGESEARTALQPWLDAMTDECIELKHKYARLKALVNGEYENQEGEQ